MIKRKKDVVFRNVIADDIDELYRLLNTLPDEAKHFFHPHSFDWDTLMNIYNSKKDHYFVMLLNDKIIGYSMLRLFGYEVPSFGCCIFHGYEKKGYGTLLTIWTVDKARELGYKKIILKTYKDNISAQNVYTKAGFKIVGEAEDKKQYRMELFL